MAKTLKVIIEARGATTAEWAVSTRILRKHELAREVLADGTSKIKFGDGVSSWSELPYFQGSSGGGPSDEELLEHIQSLTPHPAYDDAPSFELLYENAKV